MTDLRQAAQAVLDAWDSPLWKTGTTAAKIADLRAALEQQAEPVAWNAGVAPMWPQQKEGETFLVSYTTPPQQQAEPPPEWESIKNILDEYGLDAIAFVAAWKAAQQQAEPVSHAVIAGALFDFMGWLTTRKERLILSSTDNASPAVESITEFAKMRGLSLDDAKVQDWNTLLPQQQAKPVAWDKPSASFNAWWDSYRHDPANPFAEGSAAYWAWAGWQAAQRQWVGLTDEEVNQKSASIDARLKLAFHSGMYVAQIILKEKNT